LEIKKEDYKEYLTEEYMTAKDAAAMLEISEDELRALVKKHAIPTHNVAGVFQRLKRKEVEELKIKWRIERQLFPDTDKKVQARIRPVSTVKKAGFFSQIADFWYFNDFYILCSVLIVLLLYTILASQ
jgi:excisionase family DNA binding protein